MTTEDTQIIMDTLIALADKLGIAIEQITKIFIEAQPKLAMVDLTITIIVLIIIILTFLIVWYISYKENLKNYDEKISIFNGDCVGPAFVAAVIMTFIMLFVGSAFANSLYQIVAPEYMGLKDMINTLT